MSPQRAKVHPLPSAGAGSPLTSAAAGRDLGERAVTAVALAAEGARAAGALPAVGRARARGGAHRVAVTREAGVTAPGAVVELLFENGSGPEVRGQRLLGEGEEPRTKGQRTMLTGQKEAGPQVKLKGGVRCQGQRTALRSQDSKGSGPESGGRGQQAGKESQIMAREECKGQGSGVRAPHTLQWHCPSVWLQLGSKPLWTAQLQGPQVGLPHQPRGHCWSFLGGHSQVRCPDISVPSQPTRASMILAPGPLPVLTVVPEIAIYTVAGIAVGGPWEVPA